MEDADRLLADLLPVMDNAEACGSDCQMFRAKADELRKRFAAIRQNFMTPPPK